MSTSFIYHAFGLRDYFYKTTRFIGGIITFELIPKPEAVKCPEFNSRSVTRKGIVTRDLRTIPVGSKPVILRTAIQRVWCSFCQFVRQIAIDEISIGKGHKYLTIVMDLESGRILHVGEGKGGEALKSFWTKVKISKAKIKAVSIDMSPAYLSAVIENLSGSAIVFDRFHVVKLFNEKLSDFRRKLYNLLANTGQQKLLKGVRWLLLKNPENLSDDKKEAQRLEEALKINQPLLVVYYMKEELRQIWNQKKKETAEKIVSNWINLANISKIPMLMKFAKTLAVHRQRILSYYDYRISTGPLEGTNNKIKTMKRKAYGYRDSEFFRLKLLDLHNKRYALIG
ncbi:MAG: ISL3 family transposase [Desulfobacter sp.]|nr:MAG: ISL3 family transposase [Desulfobacter sp.]